MRRRTSRSALRRSSQCHGSTTLDRQRFLLALTVVALFVAAYATALLLPEGPAARLLPIAAQQLALVLGYYFGHRDRQRDRR